MKQIRPNTREKQFQWVPRDNVIERWNLGIILQWRYIIYCYCVMYLLILFMYADFDDLISSFI